MRKIKSLNKTIEVRNEEIEVMIAEMLEREEFACTGNVCAGDVQGI